MKKTITLFSLLLLYSAGSSASWAQTDGTDSSGETSTTEETTEATTEETTTTVANSQLAGSVGTDPSTTAEVFANDYLSRTAWTWWTNSSCTDNQEGTTKDGNIKAMFDGNTTTYWHSGYGSSVTLSALPMYVKIDLGATQEFYGFAYYPRLDDGTNGKITSWRFYYSDTDFTEDQITAILANTSIEGYNGINGTFSYSTSETRKYAYFDNHEKKSARYVLFIADASLGSTANAFASCSEFYLLANLQPYGRAQLSTELESWSNHEWVGMYDGSLATNYTKALEDVTSSSATYEEMTTRLTALNNERSEDKLLKIESGHIYEIVSAYSGFTTERALLSTSSAKYKWKTLPATLTTDLNYYWHIYPSGDGYLIQSFAEGTYPNNISSVSPGTMGTSTSVALATYHYWTFNELTVPGQYNLTFGTTTPMHCNGHNSGSGTEGDVIPSAGAANSPSAWKIRLINADNLAAACAANVTSGFDEVLTADNIMNFSNYLKFANIKTTAETYATASRVVFGEGYGKFTMASGNTGDAAKVEVNTWLTAYAAVTPLTLGSYSSDNLTAYNGITFNTPASGTFIRLRSARDSQRYLCNGNYSTVSRCAFQNDQDNINTVFYYTGSKLLNYASGLYVDATASNGFACYNGITTGTDFTFSFPAYTSTPTGQVNAVFATSRYLYCSIKDDVSGKTGQTDAGGAVTESTSDVGYRFTIEDVEALGVTITSAGCATFCSPVAVTLPDGVQAYIGSVTQRDGENVLTLTELTGEIPANIGVVLFAGEGTYNLPINKTPANTQSVTGNALTGLVASTAFASGNYTLQVVGDQVGFYQYAAAGGETLYMNGFHAYLPSSAIPASDSSEESPTRGLSFEFGGQTTGIASATSATAAAKGIYDLSGRRVNHLAKGLYIVNGQKVLVK